ncbi:hypothetical protein BV22DRAFT_318886 [Leucogyrophana mollusca]|uniref:Uncharacterized protein n=1 Tax=Leucogyrophana mollusca TaxID=85980 RepID=A0ACB8BM02_9AGAM|nr:hypothetical protein BV22DRAFT_318886 [Leucogyrophana mollusca]
MSRDRKHTRFQPMRSSKVFERKESPSGSMTSPPVRNQSEETCTALLWEEFPVRTMPTVLVGYACNSQNDYRDMVIISTASHGAAQCITASSGMKRPDWNVFICFCCETEGQRTCQ